MRKIIFLTVAFSCFSVLSQAMITEKERNMLPRLRKEFETKENCMSGWFSSSLDENPRISLRKNEKEWKLFVKKKCSFDDFSYFSFLIAEKCFSRDAIICNVWFTEEDSIEDDIKEVRDQAYLWIRKERFKCECSCICFESVERAFSRDKTNHRIGGLM